MPLPLYININRSENLTAQMGHRWPIIGGYVARPPSYPFAQYTPGIREIQFGEVERQDVVLPAWPESGRRALAAYRIRYITMDLESNKDEYFARVRPLLADLGIPSPIFVDETLEVYTTPDTWTVAPIAFLGRGGNRSNASRIATFAGAGWGSGLRCVCSTLLLLRRLCDSHAGLKHMLIHDHSPGRWMARLWARSIFPLDAYWRAHCTSCSLPVSTS
jgi:hypothetical protein